MLKRSSLLLLRCAVGIGVAALLLVAAVGLALRFWIMPGIEGYKPRIALAISDATGLSARLTRVAARWNGWKPVLTFEGIEFYDAEGRNVLGFNRVEGVLSWWSVPARKPQFVALDIIKPSLSVRRDAQGRIYVAGVALAATHDGDAAFGEWLLHQPRVTVSDAQIEWLDEMRQRPALKLMQAQLVLENRGAEHKLSLNARPPAEVAADLRIVAQLRGGDLQRLEAWSGTLYAETSRANLATLNQYLPVISKLRSGIGSVKAWADVANGRPSGVTAEVDLSDVDARLRDDLAPLRLSSLSGKFAYSAEADRLTFTTRGLRGQFSSPRFQLAATDLDLSVQSLQAQRGSLKANQIDLAALQALSTALPLALADRERLKQWQPRGALQTVEARWDGLERADRQYAVRARFANLGWQAVGYVPGVSGLSGSVDATQAGGSLTLDGGKSNVSMPKVFTDTLRFDTLSAQANWKRDGAQTEVNFQNVGFANSDAAGSVFGTYRATGQGPGWIDLTGKAVRGRGENIERYVPLVLNERIRQWLGQAIEGGRAKDATLRLKGDLFHFPFADETRGIFDITAQVEDVTLWYANDWPKVERAKGTLHFRGARMEIAGEGTILGVRAHKVSVVIPVLGNQKERVLVSGEADAPLHNALQVIANSPVNARLHGRTAGLRGSGDGSLKLQLDLPLHDFSQSQLVGEYTFKGNMLDDQQRGFPALSELHGKLNFTGDSVSAKGLTAHALGAPIALDLISGKQGLEINAQGEADLTRLHAEYGHALLKGLGGRARWDGKMSLDAQQLRLNVNAAGALFGAPAKVSVVRAEDGVLRIDARGAATQAELARALPDIDWKFVDSAGDWHAQLSVANGKTDVKLDANAVVLGKPARITAQGPSENLRIVAEGSADVRRLAQVYPGAWSRRLSGEGAWRAELVSAPAPADASTPARNSLRVTSDLRGITSMLPAPLGKTALQPLSLSVDIAPGTAQQDVLRIALGDRASAQLVRAPGPGGKRGVVRGSVQLGGAAPVPAADGLVIAGDTAELDLSAWLDFLREPNAAGASASAGENNTRMLAINAVDVRAQRFTAIGRVFQDVGLRLRSRASGWRAVLDGAQLSGTLEWAPASATGGATGKLIGNFARVLLPSELAPRASDTATTSVPLQPKEFPALAFTVQDLQIKQRRLGRLNMSASPESGNTWRINTLSLHSDAAKFDATGLWSGVNATPGTGIDGTWSISNLGVFMDAMGYSKTVGGGKAELHGKLAWEGAPFDFNTATLGGEFKLSAEDGQFLKVQPGAGKLLSLISLQALPRRITLDFRDVFSDGFAFDSIKSRVAVVQGVMRTDNFEMKGTGARVLMTGEADTRNETQKLRVKVLPSLGGTVAVAGTIAGGPVAGVGVYVLQKILKEPFDEILAYEYDISGNWADPQVKKVPRPLPPERPRPR